MTNRQTLPPGPELRRIIAQRTGWHMRKVFVGSQGIEYDFIVYDNDDRMIYLREITAEDLHDEDATTRRVWLEAMNDEECPRWDEDTEDALWLIDQTPYQVSATNGQFNAWVGQTACAGSADVEALALMRAWLAWTDLNPTGFSED